MLARRSFFVSAALCGLATGCPGDDISVNGETGGPMTTGVDTTGSTTMTTGVTASTTAPDESSSGVPTTGESEGTTGEPSSTTDEPSTGTPATESSGSTAAESSSGASSSGGVIQQDCPYGELMVPDTVSTSTQGEDSEFASMCGGNGAPDVSYLLTAPQDGVYVIDTVGSSIDTILAVYDGECGGLLITCNNDDPIAAPQSRVSVDLLQDQTVTVVADGFAVAGGAVTINVAFYEGVCPNGDLGSTIPQASMGSTMASDNTLFGSCGGSTAGDEAFTFTAPEPGVYTFDTSGSDFDTVLYVRDDCLGVELGCNDNGPVDSTSSLALTLAQDEQVVVVVDGAGLESGNYDLNIDLDACPDADLGNTVPQSVMSTTVGLLDTSAGSCGFAGGAPDVAYTFTAPSAGTYIFDTEGSAFDTVVYVYDGATCDGTELGCNDDSGGTLQSQVVVDLAAGQLVTVIVDGYGANAGNYTLNITSPVCGNGVADPFEDCDGADLDGQTCMTLGFPGGVLSCDATCNFDLTMCDSCGDDIVNGADVCDQTALDQMTCEDLGYTGGALDCAGDCSGFDVAECSNSVVAVCSQPNAFIDDSLPDTPDTIMVGNIGTIVDVDVFVDVTHTYVGDLDFVLSADDLALSNNLALNLCLGDNDVWAFFNDEGNGAPTCVEPIGIEGNVTPATALSVYDGSAAAGSWTLTVTDDAFLDSGTFNEWCLYFTVM